MRSRHSRFTTSRGSLRCSSIWIERLARVAGRLRGLEATYTERDLIIMRTPMWTLPGQHTSNISPN
jgi:hypothetical protein